MGTVLDRLRYEPNPLSTQIGRLAADAQKHPVWGCLRALEDVRLFMEHHVWAVWDFMSLLKSIQAEIAPTRVPWVPPADPDAARFINEIVVGEESDQGPDGQPASHFEIYVRAMKAAGARTQLIESFVAAVARGELPEAVLQQTTAPASVHEFVRNTLEVCRASLPERVAAFTVGREEIIPSMFISALQGLPDRRRLEDFIWYLERHVAIDSDRHRPLAARLFEKICLRDEAVRTAALQTAWRALKLRIALWDGVVEELLGRPVR